MLKRIDTRDAQGETILTVLTILTMFNSVALLRQYESNTEQWLTKSQKYHTLTQSDLDLVKSFTPVKTPYLFNFTQEKLVYRDIFGQKLKI